MKKLNAIGDNILVIAEPPKKQIDGLFIPEQAIPPASKGEVVTFGEEITEVEIGDTIYFPEHLGTKLSYEGVEYLCLKKREIIAFNK